METIIGYFDKSTSLEIIERHGRSDCIVASSVFTHLDDVDGFVDTVKTTLSEDGVLIIEVEYLPSIINELQFERFYFDRPNYFSLTTLVSIFERHEMEVYDVEKISPHGGSVRAYVKHSVGPCIRNQKVKKILQKEKLPSPRSGFIRDLMSLKSLNELSVTLKKLNADGNLVCGYGAPARLSTITNFGQIGPGFRY